MLHVTLNPNDGLPLYLQLVRQVKQLIATGRLEPGSELPAVRVLAQQLIINPNTVVRAYRELEVAGLIHKRRGAGTYVSDSKSTYSDAERVRLLTERADALLVEGRNLGFTYSEIIDVLATRQEALLPEIEMPAPEEAEHGS